MRIRVHTSPALQAWGITMLRVVVGVVSSAHGLQKVFVTAWAALPRSWRSLAFRHPLRLRFC